MLFWLPTRTEVQTVASPWWINPYSWDILTFTPPVLLWGSYRIALFWVSFLFHWSQGKYTWFSLAKMNFLNDSSRIKIVPYILLILFPMLFSIWHHFWEKKKKKLVEVCIAPRGEKKIKQNFYFSEFLCFLKCGYFPWSQGRGRDLIPKFAQHIRRYI